MCKNTPVEISRGYVEISRGRVLKSAGGMSKSAVPPCRNRQHIDNSAQQAFTGNSEHKAFIGIRAKATIVAFKHPVAGALCIYK